MFSSTKAVGRRNWCGDLEINETWNWIVDMVNPFDLRTILLERHAQHVVFIHFPIAMFLSGVLFDFVSRGKCDSQLAGAAYLNLSVAAAFLIPTVVTGVLAWQLAYGGARLEGLLLLHFIAAMAATVLIIATWWLHCRARKSRMARLPRFRFAIELLGVVIIGLAAHLGGFLGGVNH